MQDTFIKPTIEVPLLLRTNKYLARKKTRKNGKYTNDV